MFSFSKRRIKQLSRPLWKPRTPLTVLQKYIVLTFLAFLCGLMLLTAFAIKVAWTPEYAEGIVWNNECFSQEDVNRYIRVDEYGNDRRIRLILTEYGKENLKGHNKSKKAELAEHYANRFNKETRHKQPFPPPRTQSAQEIVLTGKRDNVLRVIRKVDENDNASYQLKYSSLKDYNRKLKSKTTDGGLVGAIFGSGAGGCVMTASNGHIRLFFKIDGPKNVTVDLFGKSQRLFVGQSFHLTGEKGAIGKLILKRTRSGAENEVDRAYEIVEDITKPFYVDGLKNDKSALTDGDFLTVDGYNLRISALHGGLPLAFSKPSLKGKDQRVYLLGRSLPFIGPGGGNMGVQRIGVDAIFADVLEESSSKKKAGENPENLELSIDPFLQEMIDEKFTLLAEKNCQMPIKKRASFCLMNALTGEVIALAQSGYNTYDPNSPWELRLGAENMSKFRHKAMNRHVIGSTGKPLFAFCVLQNYPYLKDLIVDYTKVGRTNTQRLLGFDFGSKPVRSDSWIKPLRNDGSDFAISFSDYLTYSINHYQISLGIAALGGYATKGEFITAVKASRHQVTSNGRRFRVIDRSNDAGRILKGKFIRQSQRGAINHMETSPIADAYKKYFDVAIDTALEPFDYSFCEGAGGDVTNGKADMAVPETVILGMNQIISPLDLKNFLLGGRRCFWTDVKLCEAFSRIITGKATIATIIKRHNGYQPLTLKAYLKNKHGDAAANIYNSRVHNYIRAPLRRVPLVGTAYIRRSDLNIRDVLRTINANYSKTIDDGRKAEFALFAKTGTIREHILRRQLPRGQRVRNSKLFLFTMGWWDEEKKKFVGDAYTGACYIQASKDGDALLFFVRDNLMRWYKYLYTVYSRYEAPRYKARRINK